MALCKITKQFIALLVVLLLTVLYSKILTAQSIFWEQLSTESNDIAVAGIGNQVGTLIFDIDMLPVSPPAESFRSISKALSSTPLW